MVRLIPIPKSIVSSSKSHSGFFEDLLSLPFPTDIDQNPIELELSSHHLQAFMDSVYTDRCGSLTRLSVTDLGELWDVARKSSHQYSSSCPERVGPATKTDEQRLAHSSARFPIS